MSNETKEVTIPTSVKRTLHAAIKRRAKGKAMESEAKELITGAKADILPILAAYDVPKYELKGVGIVAQRVNRGSAINAGKLREELLLAGVDPLVIEKCIRKATKSWQSEYVEFKYPKS